MISKIQNDKNNYFFKELFYERARDAMQDIVKELVFKGYKKIYIPGYIGWSPKEGSGIFDPLNSIDNLSREYYVLDRELNINDDYLENTLCSNSILLIVNYFGFRDKNINKIINFAHKKSCVVIEDNAHGFFTYHLNEKVNSDFSFFSLHKMFPFPTGGSLIINNKKKFDDLTLSGKKICIHNPYSYDIKAIGNARIKNYYILNNILKRYEEFIKPLKNIDDLKINIPQTFPVVLLKGNRDDVYEILNCKGFGVVSLYHTMINELQHSNLYNDSLWLSKHILNLPVHQDVDSEKYEGLVENLILAIKETDNSDRNT